MPEPTLRLSASVTTPNGPGRLGRLKTRSCWK